MSETVYALGAFPGHKDLAEILDQGPMPEKPGMPGSALRQNTLDHYLTTVQHILEDRGYPTTSMELDALINLDDDPDEIDELAMYFTLLLRLVHRTRSAWQAGQLSRFGYYMGQLSKVTAEAKYYKSLPYAISGMKSYMGGKKSAEKRTKTIKPSHQEILRYCTNLLAVGRAKHELAMLAYRKFSGLPGFPTSDKQYRNIVKKLKDDKS